MKSLLNADRELIDAMLAQPDPQQVNVSRLLRVIALILLGGFLTFGAYLYFNQSACQTQTLVVGGEQVVQKTVCQGGN